MQLSDPLSLPCGVTLPNRIAKAAMSEDMAEGGVPGEALVRLYRRWGAGGVGLLISGNVMIDFAARGEPGNVVIENDSGLDALRRWTEAARAGGAHFWAQINHPGRQSPRALAREPVAPSAVPMAIPGGVFAKPRALRGEEVEALIARFARAAEVCKRAGFTGVEVHGAHGYLVSQFLSPLTNLRDDEWGGDAVRRRRFLVEIVRAMRAAVGPEFPIGVKLNSADFQRGGFEESESMEVVEVLEAEGVDLLEISGGTYEKPSMTGSTQELKASTAAREAYFLEYAGKVRKRTKMPLLLTGGFRTRVGMEAALNSGAIDLIGLARPMAQNPELPRGLLDGTVQESQVQPRRTGIAQLDGMLEVFWYSYQLKRIGAGKEPNPNVWPWWVIAQSSWRAMTG